MLHKKYKVKKEKLTLKEQDEYIKNMQKELKEKLAKYQTYTWEELAEFEKQGIAGDVCRCQACLMNSMTVECVMCGKILPKYAKNYLKRLK